MKTISDRARALWDATAPVGPTIGSTRFTAWLRENKVTTAEIAKRIGCTEVSIRNWKRGVHVPTIEIGRRIELITGIPIVAWVLRPEPQPDPIAEIESLSLDVDGPAVEPEPVRGPVDLSDLLEDALAVGGVE